MDDTVNSLLEMIATEREAKSALEHHLRTATAALEEERRRRVSAEDDLAETREAADDDADAAERKLREATDIIGELRQALLDVMRVKDGSVNGSDGGRRLSSSQQPKSPETSRPQQGRDPNKSRWLEGGGEGRGGGGGAGVSDPNVASRTGGDAGVDLYADIGGRATAILRAIAAKVAAHPAFELAWPLMCIVLLLRFQLGPDVFTWRSLTWSAREPPTVAAPDL